MARFSGKVGFSTSSEVRPGVWEDSIVERQYYGDVVRDQRKINSPDKVLFDIDINNSFSIVGDAYAENNLFAIRYVRWAGTVWTVTNVEVRRPRLILSIGGVYNGPTA